MSLLLRLGVRWKAGVRFAVQSQHKLYPQRFFGRLKRITRNIIKKTAVAVAFKLLCDIIRFAVSAPLHEHIT